MSTKQTTLAIRITTGIACSALMWITGCVGPMSCGPCGGNGPLAMNSCNGCGACEGCGELYIDPWINEPPCSDPCDKCGNHNGQSCGKCRSIFDGFESLWGYRCQSGCDECGSASCGGGCGASCGGALGGGCDSCGGGGCDSCSSGQDPMYISSDPIPTTEYVESMPSKVYQPRRTKQIFTPRGGVATGTSGHVAY